MSSSLTIVIPAYNEEASLREFLPQVVTFCLTNNYKLILVNDGSGDNTRKVAESILQGSHQRVINHKVNRGYGGAIKSGVQACDTDYLVTIDADGQHHLEDINLLYSKLKEADADMIVGNRGMSTDGLYRKTGKSLIRYIARQLMPLHIQDINSGMKMYDTRIAQQYLRLCPDSMAYSDIIALVFISQRHKVIEEPISIKPRTAGISTIGARTAIETIMEIVNIVILFNPMKVFLPVSILFVTAGVLWDIPIFLRGDGVSVGAVLLIICGLMFFFFGLIAEQISLIRKNRE